MTKFFTDRPQNTRELAVNRQEGSLSGFMAALAGLIFWGISAPAWAGNIEVSIDSTLADYVLDIACSGKQVDESWLRNSKIIQAQIEHHSSDNKEYSIENYIEALKAAARCERLEKDLFRFRYVVENKQKMAEAIAFLKAHERELSEYIVSRVTPYTPEDLSYRGQIVLSPAGRSCGGFATENAFFIDVPCSIDEMEEDFEATKAIAAHEMYHALQYRFFAPTFEDSANVQSSDDAQRYLFSNLMLEGMAEYVVNTEDLPGSGTMASVLREYAAWGYYRVAFNMRMFDHFVAALEMPGDVNRRARDFYSYGFTGDFGENFYFLGSTMAKGIETAYGRDGLVCILKLPAEQFVLAYSAVAGRDGAEIQQLGEATLRAAERLAKRKQSYRTCI